MSVLRFILLGVGFVLALSGLSVFLIEVVFAARANYRGWAKSHRR